MLMLNSKLGGASAGRAALDFILAAARTVGHLAGVGSDTVHGFTGERLMSIPVDTTHLRWRVQR